MNPTPQATATAAPRNRQITAVSAAAVTALALVFFMISSVTGAAWTDTTDNSNNSWATGEVRLADDEGGLAMFTAANMLPGDGDTATITVENESTVPLAVKLYAAEFTNTNSLGAQLDLVIRENDSTGEVVYEGTLSGFDTDHPDYDDGAGAITLAPDATQTYYFSVHLNSDAPDSAQGSTAGITFVWEGHTE